MYNSYTVPSRLLKEDVRLGWLQDAVREGETFIRNQTAYMDFPNAKNIVAGMQRGKIPQQLSKINVNLQKRIIRDVVATMSNLRPLWGYASDNEELAQESEMLNKLLINWYQSTFSDIQIKKCLQYAGVFGTGYIGPDWKSNYWVRGRGEIVLKVYSPEDVLPIQLPQDNDLQRAYGVTLREAVPINLARAMFPTMAGKIVPDRQSPNGLRKGLTRLKTYLSPVLNRFASDQKTNRTVDTTYPVVDIYQTYLLDLSVNEGPDELVMGEPGTSWSYVVPVLGSNIPDGVNP